MTLRRRRQVAAVVTVAGAGLLGASLSTEPGSQRFYTMTFGVAGTWVAGGFASGPIHLGRGTVIAPIAIGAGAFAGFYATALVARRIPILRRAIAGVLQYENRGSSKLVLLTTLTNGVAEEVFFRGGVYAAADGKRPVVLSTAAYAMATTATRNPALVLASIVMGTLFALQRRATGGIQAPIIAHITWSALMLRFLPALFHTPPTTPLS
ncbi:MAG: CPBP family intramembrane glutamic endopeptidase [Kibdelosporangium sp.]